MRVSKMLVVSAALIAGILVAGMPAGAATTSTSTNVVYIWPGNLYQGPTSGNGLNLREIGTGSFAIVPGPETPPFGNASAQFSIGAGPATGRVDIWANEFADTPLSSITSMGLSTFIASGQPPGGSASYQLPIFATPNGTDPTFTTLSFIPFLQGVPVPAGWSNWDVMAGQWTASNAALSSQIPGGCQTPTPCSFSQIRTAFPDAILHGVNADTGVGGVGLIVGTTTGPATSAANNWSFGVNGVTTIFDFHTGPPPEGYWLNAKDGGIFNFGAAPFQGSDAGTPSSAPMVGIAAAPDGGYWQVDSAGGVFAHGAGSFGSMAGQHLNAPIVGMAATSDGGGYYLVGADGGVFTFGDAHFHGSMGGQPLNKPVVGIAATPDNQGYYLVASDGGVFTFGDAQFQGSMGGQPLNKPVVGMSVDAATSGYWLVASDGGVFSFGAPFLGATGDIHLNAPVVGMAVTADDLGYRFVGADGGVFSFGTAQFFGSMAGQHLNQPVVGIASIG